MSASTEERVRAGSPPRAASRVRVDVLRWPVVGPFLRWRRSRLVLQLLMGSLALVLVIHGLFGPALAPKNLATLLVWVHWRGALVITLLVAGNLFCMGCPLLLPREVARRFSAPVRRFPRALRRKWVGAGLLVLVLLLYELLDLWASPQATALLILAYFGAALLVDALFAGAPFCKWVCPIGQFNFVASTFSPLEVGVREASTCDACTTKDCIKGTRSEEDRGRVVQRGCELGLFLPRKVGNMDCTFCMDCVHACPEDNVGLHPRLPGEELTIDPLRSGVGRFSRRPDIAVLVVLFAFGALLNAFGMVRPVYEFQSWMSAQLGTRNEGVILGLLFVLGLVLVPALLLGATGLAVRAATGAPVREHLVRFAYALAPVGFGVWLAHYSFHFLTGLWTFVPVSQLALIDLGVQSFGAPRWGLGGLTEAQVWPVEIGFVSLGTAGSLAVGWRLAQREYHGRARRAFAPWAVLVLSFCAVALWLLAQPMEMRGTFL